MHPIMAQEVSLYLSKQKLKNYKKCTQQWLRRCTSCSRRCPSTSPRSADRSLLLPWQSSPSRPFPPPGTGWQSRCDLLPVEPFTWVQYQLGHLGPIPFTWVQYQLSPGSYIRWKEEASDFSSTARQPTRPALADTRFPNIFETNSIEMFSFRKWSLTQPHPST